MLSAVVACGSSSGASSTTSSGTPGPAATATSPSAACTPLTKLCETPAQCASFTAAKAQLEACTDCQVAGYATCQDGFATERVNGFATDFRYYDATGQLVRVSFSNFDSGGSLCYAASAQQAATLAGCAWAGKTDRK